MMRLILICATIATIWAKPGLYWEDFAESNESTNDGQHTGSTGTNCSCGWTNKERIVGGRETLKSEFPLMTGMVSLEDKELFCGSAIVSPHHALTASHCTTPYKNRPIFLAIGQHVMTEALENITGLIPIERTIEHDRYDDLSLINDIALLILKEEIPFTKTVGPVCLPNQYLNLENNFVTILGWGLTKEAGDQSNVLMKVNLKVISMKQCHAKYPADIPVKSKNYLCTFRQKKDACQGDSGGPVIWLDPETNRYTLVALVSYGKVCGSEFPAINTNIGYYLNWIQRKISLTTGEKTCAKINTASTTK